MFEFRPFREGEIPLFYEWAKRPHIESVWFLDGYEHPSFIEEMVAGNGIDEPYMILRDGEPFGFIMCSALAEAEGTAHLGQVGPGSYSVDLFIADEENLGQGHGTEIVRLFAAQLLERPEVEEILIDPAADNLKAVRCYLRAGFVPLHLAHDGVSDVEVLRLSKAEVESASTHR